MKGTWILKAHKDYATQALPTGYGFIRFDPDKNAVNGFDGCNSFQGGYRTDVQGKVSFSPFMKSLVLCTYTLHGPSPSLLDRVITYVRKGDSLTLLDAQGQVRAQFIAYRPKQPARPASK